MWKPRTTKTSQRSYVLNKAKLSYWISVGAKPTRGAEKFLEKFDLWPKRPPPFGTKYLYEKPEREYGEHAMNIFSGMHNVDKDQNVKDRIKKEIDKLTVLREFENQIMAQPDTLEEMNTTDIESDDGDIFNRKMKFDELSRRFNNHKAYSYKALGGNDYQLNNYLRKMQKLSKNRQGGIDLAGYQDYLNNMTEFKKIKDSFTTEKDPHRAAEFNVDFSQNSETSTGRGTRAFYDIDQINGVKDKAERLTKIREIFLKVLKDEVEHRNRLESLPSVS